MKSTIRKDYFTLPAKVSEMEQKGNGKSSHETPLKKASRFWHMLGPGLTTGAADDDPSGIATYSQAGAKFGFQYAWLAIFTFPFMAVVQEMCARIGLVTGRGLAANIRRHYPKWVLYACAFLLFAANTLNIGANLGAMAKATQLILPSLNFGLLIAGFSILCLALQIFITYQEYAKYLKWLALILLSYIFSALFINFDWSAVAKATFIPSIQLDRDHIFLLCALLGTTISPYLFFWQTSQEVEEEILSGHATIHERQTSVTKSLIRNMKIDVWSGMLLSNLVMFFIIITCAATLFSSGITNIKTAAEAAEALKPLAGNQASLLFALGIIGTGLLAVPVLAGSASYAISEAAGYKQGLYRKLKQAKAFYGIIIFSMALGLIINFLGIDPIQTLIWSAVINGIIAPVILFFIVHISSNKQTMGIWVSGSLSTKAGWLIFALLTVTSAATIISLL